LGGSEYLKLRTGKTEGLPPDVDLVHENTCMRAVLALIQSGQVQAVQDVSLGGLLTTLVEMTFEHEVGVSLSLQKLKTAADGVLRLDELLFGETAGSYLVAYRPEAEASLRALTDSIDFIPFAETLPDFELKLDDTAMDLRPAKKRWSTTLARL
jgi:phosphoribosylformylglycinamidine (FGAM) synthase-like enzyme